jgi:hypothetical protein
MLLKIMYYQMNKLKNILDFRVFEFSKYSEFDISAEEGEELYNDLSKEMSLKYNKSNILHGDSVLSVDNTFGFVMFYFTEKSTRFNRKLKIIIRSDQVEIHILMKNPNNPNLKVELKRIPNRNITYSLYLKDRSEYFEKLFNYVDNELIVYNRPYYKKALINFGKMHHIDKVSGISDIIKISLRTFEEKYGKFWYMTADEESYNLTEVNRNFVILNIHFIHMKESYYIKMNVDNIKEDSYNMILTKAVRQNDGPVLDSFQFKSEEFVDCVEILLNRIYDDLDSIPG